MNNLTRMVLVLGLLLASLAAASAMDASSSANASPVLKNFQIAPAVVTAMETQFDVPTVVGWDEEYLQEVFDDAWSQLSASGTIKPTASYAKTWSEIKQWHYDFKNWNKHAKVGSVSLGRPVPLNINWDELVREYFLANGIVNIGHWWDPFTAQVHNSIPKTQHSMTVLGEQEKAIAND